MKQIKLKNETALHPYLAFGIFGVITYPVYFFIWKFANAGGYENLPLRLGACILCLPLIFHKKLPLWFKELLPLYWYGVLLYCLPFLFTFLLLKNNFSTVWVMNTMTVLVLGVLLLDVIELIIILPVGIFFGWVCYWLTTDSVVWPANPLSIVITYGSVILFGALFAHRKEKLQELALNMIQARKSGATIAHEIRTPLAAIKIGASSLYEDFVPYEKKENIPVLEREEVLRHAKEAIPVLKNILAEANLADTVIDMLLLKSDISAINQDEFETCSVHSTIQEALERYPFDLGEEELVHWHKREDFSYHGKQLLMVHVLFNLLKNAFYQIKAADKGSITIWTEVHQNSNQIHFRDTASGVARKDLPKIFDKFFSRVRHGTGLGLYFCKMVMASCGGKIKCQSVLGEYTEFILTFPKINSK